MVATSVAEEGLDFKVSLGIRLCVVSLSQNYCRNVILLYDLTDCNTWFPTSNQGVEREKRHQHS